MQLQQGAVFWGCNHSFIFRLPHSLGLRVAPTVAFTMPGGQAVYTTHRPGSYPTRNVVSLRVRHGQLTRLDSHQLDCSLVGCSFPHRAFTKIALTGGGERRYECDKVHKTYFSSCTPCPLTNVPSCSRPD